MEFYILMDVLDRTIYRVKLLQIEMLWPCPLLGHMISKVGRAQIGTLLCIPL